MKIEVTSVAERQLLAAGRFYERQSPGLGDYFLDSLMADIESLHIYAGIHAVYFEKYFRLLAKRFPYSVYYRVENDKIRVYAVVDNRRHPEQIRRRLIGR